MSCSTREPNVEYPEEPRSMYTTSARETAVAQTSALRERVGSCSSFVIEKMFWWQV